MSNTCETVNINGQTYIRADKLPASKDDNGHPYVIIRSYGAGVFAGYLKKRNDETRVVKMDKCIRLWRWTGCSLSQVSQDGIAGTGENKFSVPVDNHEILQVIEIIPCTEKARKAIQGVKSWKK